MTKLPKAGDKVSWGTPQGRTEGVVVKTITKTARVKGHVAKASPEHPEVVVKSSKSGKPAVHRPEHLKKA